MRKVIIALPILFLACCACKDSTNKQTGEAKNETTTDSISAPGPGWKLAWHDEFNYSGLPDSSLWNYDTGGHGWGNNELQYYTYRRLENARVESGNLVIEARKEPWLGREYTSTRLVTKGKGEWQYGRFEVKARIPSGLGTWPAIWTLATNDPLGWPDDGEMDIMEHVGFN